VSAQFRPQADDPAYRQAVARLLDGYAPAAAGSDLLLAADGRVRPHWHALIDGFAALPPAVLLERQAAAERLFHENGIAYNAFADPGKADRPRAFDACPLILTGAEWQGLETGLIQQARLLNALLVDCYGEQRLLAQRRLPPALVLGNPRFLRPCHGLMPRGGGKGLAALWLHTLAIDLMRESDGTWRVVRTHTESPSGSGHALENRIVLSHSLPELFVDHPVRRLTGYFQHKRDTLAAMTGRDDPRIVVLTTGPDGDAFLADSVLARTLGYPLVEGGDLTVRSDKVYLKTVEGLMPVDAIVRKIDSADADPLVSGTESNHGVAGLTRAARAGNVAIANAIGSGLLESPAITAFLPGLCRDLLGEGLHLAGLPTWWGGHTDARAHIRTALDSLLIGPSFPRPGGVGTGLKPGWRLTPTEQERLCDHLDWRGYDLIAQAAPLFSSTPAWRGDRLDARPFLLRTFVCAGPDGAGGIDYRVLPGGFATVPPGNNDTETGSHTVPAETLDRLLAGHGTVSKDVWVLADEIGGNGFALSTTASAGSASGSAVPPPPVRRTAADLPSRAADNMFWLGRYAERAEDILRVVRAVLLRLEEGTQRGGDLAAMTRLAERLTEPTKADAAATENVGAAEIGTPRECLFTRLTALLVEPERPLGLRETIAHLQRVAVLVRDRLSVDAWRTLNEPSLDVATWRAPQTDRLVALGDQLSDALQTLSAFSGLQMENMTRNDSWRFLMLGRRIERAHALADMLRALLVDAGESQDVALTLLLEVADSFMTYRSRYLARPMAAPILDLLLMDETNPRSLAFQLAALEEGVNSLPRAADAAAERTPDQRTALSMLARLRLSERDALYPIDPETGRRDALDALLQAVQDSLPTLSDQLARTYFSHAERNRTEATRTDDLSEP